MALKATVHEVCERCGQVDARRDGDWIVDGLHKCPSAPPGPPSAPRRLHIKSIVWETAGQQIVRLTEEKLAHQRGWADCVRAKLAQSSPATAGAADNGPSEGHRVYWAMRDVLEQHGYSRGSYWEMNFRGRAVNNGWKYHPFTTLVADITKHLVERAEAAEAELSALRAAVQQGAAWFREYEASHRQKGATEKADRNKERAEFLEAALPRMEPR